jgi:type I restriction enzyme S subunit
VKPGYKRTEVGVIPEDWDVKQLRSVVTYLNGKAHEEYISRFGKYVVVNSKFISTNGEVRKFSDHCLGRVDVHLAFGIPTGSQIRFKV